MAFRRCRDLGPWAAVAVMLASGVALAAPGNAWHIPTNAEPDIASMRGPVYPYDDAAVEIFSGNQFQGPGDPGNQLQTGSAVIHRPLGGGAWTETPLLYSSQSGNNIYYRAELLADIYAAGEHVEYYLRIPYSDHDTTYVYGADDASTATADEALALADPFVYAVQPELAPQGAPELHALGGVQVGWYPQTGHLVLVGPDREGNAGATEIVFSPLRARIGNEWYQASAVLGSTELGDGFELTQQLGARTITARWTTSAEGVLRFEVTDWDGSVPTHTELVAASPTDEHFYGFGEKFNAFDQTGRTTRVTTSDPPGDKGDLSYKAAPWFVSTRGYGFLLDSTAESTFDLRNTETDRYRVTLDHGALAFQVVYGPELTDVVSRYTALTGRAPLPPDWAFGPWMSSDHWRNGGEVRYVLTRLAEEGIPGSVFVFDSPWEVAYNDFTWNETQFAAGGTYENQEWAGFASSQEMLEFLRAHGYRAVLWLTPLINVDSVDENVPGQNTGQSANYAEAEAAGYFVENGQGEPLVVSWWKGNGSPVDFTNPAARTWFQGQLQALVDDGAGVVAGFKIDDGEGTFIPDEATYADGRTGALMRNGYTIEYHQSVHDVLGSDGILFSRSGYVGTQAYPGCWAGDNEPNFGTDNGLPSVIVAGQSAAMSGYAIWGHDIGGYQDANPSTTLENLFMRWTQFGAFTPLMQMHRQVGLGLQYPWSFGPDGLDNYRAYARLHTELFPYVYSMAAAAADTGIPIVRPLVLEYPDDPDVWPIEHTYLLGDAFLVAPMLTNLQTERTVYLPAGTWIDYWTHERIEGGIHYDWISEDQTRFPLFLAEGAIVPRLAEIPMTLADAVYVGNAEVTTPTDAWSTLIVPAPELSSLQAYDTTTIEVQPEADDLLVRWTGPARPLLLEVLSPAPMDVTVDDQPLDMAADVTSLQDLESGWAVDGDTIWVKTPHTGGLSEIRFTEVPTGGTDSGTATDGSATGSSDTVDPDHDPQSTLGTDAGTSGTDTSPGSGGTDGCGCRAPKNGPAATWLVLLALGLHRRRH